MENPCVQNAHCDVVDPDVAPLKHEEAVAHYSKADVALCIAPIPKLILVKRYLPIVLNWIVLTKHVNRKVLLR